MGLGRLNAMLVEIEVDVKQRPCGVRRLDAAFVSKLRREAILTGCRVIWSYSESGVKPPHSTLAAVGEAGFAERERVFVAVMDGIDYFGDVNHVVAAGIPDDLDPRILEAVDAVVAGIADYIEQDTETMRAEGVTVDESMVQRGGLEEGIGQRALLLAHDVHGKGAGAVEDGAQRAILLHADHHQRRLHRTLRKPCDCAAGNALAILRRNDVEAIADLAQDFFAVCWVHVYCSRETSHRDA